VVIGKIKEAEGVDETISLLNKVYNGESTPILQAECENLRRHILAELQIFQQLLDECPEESDEGLKQAYQRKITGSIDRASNFAAFKRHLIRNNKNLFALFGEAIQTGQFKSDGLFPLAS
jgi:hypothetical protein